MIEPAVPTSAVWPLTSFASAVLTSAGAPMSSAAPAKSTPHLGSGYSLVSGGLTATSTTSSYEMPVSIEGTAAEPTGWTLSVSTQTTAAAPADEARAVPTQTQTTGAAVLEIRRLSGLTWEQLADLFGVTRRSVHHWASGKAPSAEHDRHIRGTLTILRSFDRGESAAMRALLLTQDSSGVSALDLLKAGRFDEARARGVDLPGCAPNRSRTPLSQEAQDARRPPPPWRLLGALQGRPDWANKPHAPATGALKKKDG